MPACATHRLSTLRRVVEPSTRRWLFVVGIAALLALGVTSSNAGSVTAIKGSWWGPGQQGDEFSFAIAVEGARFIGSSPGESESTGAAYEFDCAAIPCMQTSRFAPLDLAIGHRFGASLALSGDTLAVGAPGQSPAAVYVFIRSGSTWMQQAKLVAGGAASSTGFGRTLALAGDRLAIAAPGADNRAGAVYVFERAASSWTQAARLGADDAMAGDGFGRSMAISADTLVVGAPLKSSGTSHFANGAAYVFVDSGTWSQQAKLISQSSIDGDSFGTALAIDNERVIVGAPLSAGRKGSAYLFERIGTTWTQHEQLTNPAGVDGDKFGWSVALSGNGALVGAPFAFNACGATYSFIRSNSGWTRTDESVVGNITLGDLLGWAVAGDPTHWVVAAPGSSGPLDHSGQAYILQAGDLVFADGFEIPAANTCAAFVRPS